MTTKDALTYQQVLAAVAAWPAHKRFDLVQDVLQPLAPERVSPEERRAAFDRLEGILATPDPPPSDEDIRRWLEERRLERYG